MKNLIDMARQFGELHKSLGDIRASIGELSVDGEAGAGMVTVTLNGLGEMMELAVDPSLLSPGQSELMRNLIVAAHNHARANLESAISEKMNGKVGGLPSGLLG